MVQALPECFRGGRARTYPPVTSGCYPLVTFASTPFLRHVQRPVWRGRRRFPLTRGAHVPTQSLTRRERTREQHPTSVPQPLPGEADLVVVDTTWGEVQPIVVASGVQTV